MHSLPIEPALPALAAALADSGAAVLVAPPGAGKTTRVPLALLAAPWLGRRRIIMLEPRRVAARAAARRMAATLGEEVGATVGFRVRADTRVGRDTRIEVVTEGVLTRMLQDDPTLDDAGLIIFDEFHERSLHADLGLALVLHSRELLRPELRLLIMSATIDGAAVAALLGDAPVIVSEGRSFPVETRWLERAPENRVEAPMSRAIRQAIASDHGDLLAFLPGAGEIRRVASSLSGSLPPDVDVVPLFGALSGADQDRALARAPAGRRKVVLATSIAETSLTIDGVRIVVDSGLSRLPRFDPGPGMTRLETVRVSRASADQRRGRAGRTTPGICYRLWAEHDEHGLVAQTPPEILAADLTALALELAVAGIDDPASLRWLTPPPDGALAHARELLQLLGALDTANRATPHGRAMAALGVHPRLAHMLLLAAADDSLLQGARIAALLSDRDVAHADHAGADADIATRVDLLAGGPRDVAGRLTVDRDALHRAASEATRIEERVRAATRRAAASPGTGHRAATRTTAGDNPRQSLGSVGLSIGALVALAWPDRVARRRPGQPGRYVLRSGAGAVLADSQALTASEWLAIAELDGKRTESRIYLAAHLDESDVRHIFAPDIVRGESVELDESSGTVTARRSERLGAITLSEVVVGNPDPALVAAAFTTAVARRGIAALPWSDAARRTRQRLAFAHALDPAWPDVSDEALGLTLDDWLGPSLAGLRRLDDLRRLDLGALLLARVPWRERATLDTLAPTHIVVPTGSRIPVDYTDPAAPVLAVRLQELFGLSETPRIGGGRVALTLHLLSPAQRPVQVTRDLAGFWRTSYFDVRKDMRGRYPRHYWPENPLDAAPTRRAKPGR